ncbi:MAG: hypothetical protein ACI4XA_09820, partial [Oscillospiraceae bacterium]
RLESCITHKTVILPHFGGGFLFVNNAVNYTESNFCGGFALNAWNDCVCDIAGGYSGAGVHYREISACQNHS